MSAGAGFEAELLKRSAGGYAGVAAAQLLEREPELRAQAGAMEAWRTHLAQRAIELAAALAAGESRLFTERVLWSRKTFAARSQPDQLIAQSLQSLRDVLAESLPANARVACLEYLDAALQALQLPVPAIGASELNPEQPNDRLALKYLQLALEGKAAEAVQLIRQAVADGLTVNAAYVELLLPAQKEIGRLWHANEVSVAEEHLVTATTKQVMAVLLHTSPRATDNGKILVAACVPGNIHDIGVRALADLFSLAGWRSIYLGADVPIKDLPSTVEYFQADLVLLGSTLSTHIDPAAKAIDAIHAGTERGVKVMVGGAAFDEVPELWRRLGADAYAPDLSSALTVAADLIK